MRFENGGYLYLLALIPIFWILYLFIQRYYQRRIQVFYNDTTRSDMVLYTSPFRRHLKYGLMMLSAVALIIGIANPQVGTKTEKIQRKGIDIVLALDLSKSMLAEDLQPNRLERAKLFISSLMKKLGSDRVALIVFGGNAYLQMPLTTDHSALKLYLNNLNTDLIPTQGTNFADAIRLGMESFDSESSSNEHNTIIIISDGENHDEEAIDVAQMAGSEGFNIFAVAVGTEKGAPIPILDRYGRRLDYKKDKNGSIVLSKLNPEIMKDIAQEGNGEMVLMSDGSAAIANLKEAIDQIEKKDFDEVNFTDFDDQFQFFLLLSAMLLLLSLMIPSAKAKSTSALEFLNSLSTTE